MEYIRASARVRRSASGTTGNHLAAARGIPVKVQTSYLQAKGNFI